MRCFTVHQLTTAVEQLYALTLSAHLKGEEQAAHLREGSVCSWQAEKFAHVHLAVCCQHV